MRVHVRVSPLCALTTRLYFAGVFRSASAAAWQADPDDDLSVPTLAQFRHAVRDGTLAPGAPAPGMCSARCI